MDFDRLRANGEVGGTSFAGDAEARAIPGEELWWPPGSTAGVVVTEQTALGLTPVLAAHNTIASDVGIMPLEIYQRMATDDYRIAYEKPQRYLMRRSPNRGESSPSKWFAALMGHALSRGNGYAEIQRTGRGDPWKLHLLDPRNTRFERDADKRPGYRTGSTWIEAANVLHIAGFGYDGINGYNFVNLIRTALGLSIAAEAYASDFYANGSEPGGIVEFPGKFKTKEAKERLRDGLEGRHQGVGKRHRIAVLEENAKWHSTSIDPEKSQLTENRRFQTEDCVRPWRVPPQKYGNFEHAHPGTIDALNLDYLISCLMGWLTGIAEECNLKLLSEAEFAAGYFFQHDTEALLRADVLTRYRAHEVAVRNGWVSRNEIRRAEKKPPIPADQGGDLYTVQAQVIPLDMAGTPFNAARTQLVTSTSKSDDDASPNKSKDSNTNTEADARDS